MKIEFSIKDARDLSNICQESYYSKRKDEFEVLSENEPPLDDKGRVMYFYNTRLEALLSYKAFKEKDPNSAMLWTEYTYLIKGGKDTHWEEEYVVVTRGKIGESK